MLCFSMMYFVPAFLQKYFELLPNTKSVATNIDHPKFPMFWGFTISFIHIELFDYILKLIYFFSLHDSSWYAIFLLFPVPSVVFIIINCVVANNRIPNTDTHPRVVRLLYILTSTIISLCLQNELFYIGWLALTVVAFPTTIGLLGIKMVECIAMSLMATAAITKFRSWKTKKAKSTRSCEILTGYSFLFVGITNIILAYQATLRAVGMDYHDGVSAIMPSLTPILIIGFITWIAGRSRVTNIMWSQATDGLLEYKEEEKKSLLDGQDE